MKYRFGNYDGVNGLCFNQYKTILSANIFFLYGDVSGSSFPCLLWRIISTRVGTLIVATIYLQLTQN